MKIWSDKEVRSLFTEIEKCKSEDKSLKFAFEAHAKNFGRKPNSVRNYYYHDIENLKADIKRCKKLGIDLKKHEKYHFVPFSRQEKCLLEQIQNSVKNGESVRAACERVSGGDLKLMTRLQNKYQSTKKTKTDNVIMFRKTRKTLTETDINSLLLGLVKLIKKTAIEDFVESQQSEKQNQTQLLKEAFENLSKKERQYEQLKKNFELVKNENKQLVERINTLAFGKNLQLKEHLSKKTLKRAVQH